MKPKKDGYGFVITLFLLAWWIGSPGDVEPVPADETVSVAPSPPDEKGGDPTEDASQDANAADAGVTVSETAAPASVSQFVHTIHVRNGSTGGQGSATHIGDGVYLTCRHVFGRSVSGVEIDGVPTPATWSVASGPDFAVVRTQASSAAAARVNTAPLSDGQSLRVVGQKTGLHAGELSPQRWSHGYRTVVCAVPTQSGDSGAGVFNDAGELVGVHWGSTGNEVFFTPLSEVASMIQDVAANRNVAPFTPAAAAHTPTAPGADTSVCACEGSKRGVCHCLARGVTCRCRPGVGSEWEMANGRPVRKTGRYLDPRTPLTQPMLVVTVGKDDTVPTKRTDGRYWFRRPDGRWCGVLELTNGATYTSGGYRFVYRNGRMETAQRTGRWVTRCENGVCRRYWVEQ